MDTLVRMADAAQTERCRNLTTRPSGLRKAMPSALKRALKGHEGQKMAIILFLNGDGFKYYYEWRKEN